MQWAAPSVFSCLVIGDSMTATRYKTYRRKAYRHKTYRHETTWHEAVGAIHVHSDFSDGTQPIPKIAAIAEEKNLDFLLFSDHNTLEPKRRGLEGWHGNVLVLIGYEINDADDRNHYLAFRLNREVRNTGDARNYVRAVKKAGGIGIIAHPAEKRRFSEAYPPYPWTAWDAEGFDGIEIWNQISEWLEGVTRRNIAWRILHPLRSIRFPVWSTLARWDRINRDRRVVGIGGIDVHAYRYKVFGLIPIEIYPYKVQFRSIRTHVLTPAPLRTNHSSTGFAEAERMVYGALIEGRAFIVNASLGDGRGFRFWCSKGKEEHAMGSRTGFSKGAIFHVKSPCCGRIRLLRDGKLVSERIGDNLDAKAEQPGVYRVEVFRKKRGWIYSNPIVLLKGPIGYGLETRKRS